MDYGHEFPITNSVKVFIKDGDVWVISFVIEI